MIEIRILVSHSAPNVLHVATQTTHDLPMEVELRFVEGIDDGIHHLIADTTKSTGVRVLRKDYPLSQKKPPLPPPRD